MPERGVASTGLPRVNWSHQRHAAQLTERKEAREAANKRRGEQADTLKEEGNAHFRQGRYVEAIAKYNEAAKVYGLRPVIMSNLSAAYLKLKQYELAEWAADCALLYSPRMAKARFRRAMARKGQGMFKGAELDLRVVIERHPDITEAKTELEKVQAERKKHGDGQRAEKTYDEEFPPFDAEEWDPPLDSDSEDVRHTGNDKSCRFYNHGGCGKGALCDYSHAPDDKSIRDELGQNVCVYFLLGDCKYGAKCIYAHTADYLPQGWWNDPEQTQEAKKLQAAIDDPTTDDLTIQTLENATLYGRLKKAQDYQSDLRIYSLITPDVLKSRVKEDAQEQTNPPKVSPSQGLDCFILLLCLEDPEMFDNDNDHLLKALRAKTKFVHAKNATQASTYLDAPELAGVIVGDAGIVNRFNSGVASQLADYAKRGGTVVFGGLFPSFISGTDFSRFFSQNFGLQWERSSYFRTTFYKNTANDIVKKNSSLAVSYSMKALHVQGITSECAIYRANESSRTESLVFSPNPVSNFEESPAASVRVGSGVVGFLGDVNAEESSTRTILAMLDLLDTPSPPEPVVSKVEGSADAPPPITQKKSKGKKKKKGKKKTNGTSATPSSTPTPAVLSSSRNAQMSTSAHSEYFIMQLTLDGNDDSFDWGHKSTIAAIKAKMDVKGATTEALALALLSSPYLRGVFATDAELTEPEYKGLLKKIVSYVDGGGRLVLGGTFSCFAKFPEFEPFFAVFGLPWKAAAYTSESLTLNRESAILAENPFLPEEIDIKAVFLADVDSEDTIYYRKDINSQTAIAFGRTDGKGYVGYIGDVNGSSGTTPGVLAMFDLLKYPRPLTKPLSHKFIIALMHFISIEEYEKTPLCKRLKEKGVEVITDERLSDPRLADLLSSPDLRGVLVLDDTFSMPEREWLGHQVAAYAWSGGTVIFAGDFGTMTPPDEFEQLLTDNFCLPWKISCATELTVTLNRESLFVKRLALPVLQENMYSEGAFLYDVSPDAVVYGSQPGLGPERATHVPVACANVGNGYVAFFGHDEIGELDTKLMLGMLKL